MAHMVKMLETQANLHRKLLSVIENENTSIIENRLEDLHEATCEKEAVVNEIKNVETNIAVVLREGIPAGNKQGVSPHLRSMIEFATEPFKERMKGYHSDLLMLMEKIKIANSHNQFLLTHSLQLVRNSISLLNNLMASDPVYHRNGEVHSNMNNGRYISGEI